MTTEIYTGLVARPSGEREKIVLRKGKRYWLASDRTWFWIEDGTQAGLRRGQRPSRLVLSSIKKGDHVNKVRKVAAMDFTGLVKHACGGPPNKRNFRQTKLLWIDELGTRFRKDGGWSTNYDKDKLRLDLSTINPRQKAAKHD